MQEATVQRQTRLQVLEGERRQQSPELVPQPITSPRERRRQSKTDDSKGKSAKCTQSSL